MRMQAWTVAAAVAAFTWVGCGAGALAAPTELRGASVRAGGEVEVRLDLSGAVMPYARELPGTPGAEPSRLYLDLHGTVLSPEAVREVTGEGPVRRVRLGQFDPDTARVVIELSSPRPFALERHRKQVIVRFGAEPTPVAQRESPTRLALARAPDALERQVRPLADATTRAETAASAASGDRRSPRGDEAGGQAPATLEERVARLHRRRDWPALLALYAAEASPVGEAAPPAVRAAVADALVAVGLPERADEVLGPPERADTGVLRLSRAEIALARGDERALRALLASLDDAELAPSEAQRLARLRIRAALADGESARAAELDDGWNAGLRRALARSTVETAEAAAEVGAWDQAAEGFRRALAASDAPALRGAAAAGLLRAALELRDEAATAEALEALAGVEGAPLVRTVARSLAMRSGVALGEAQPTGAARDRDHDRDGGSR